jgi:hypothetical protein
MNWFKRCIIIPLRQLLYAPPLNGWLHAWLRWHAPKHIPTKPHYLAIGTMFKNEAPYLIEWLEYHLMVGVTHFYLYNNNSTDDYATVLAPYIQAGQVTVVDWPHLYQQRQCLADCLQRFASQAHWIALLDCDEYLVPDTAPNMPTVLRPMAHYPMVAYYWRFFGTSGQLTPQPHQLVCQQYTQCMPSNPMFKSIYNTAYVAGVKVLDAHNGKCKVGGVTVYPILPNGAFATRSTTPGLTQVPYSPVQINHYWSKSHQEYMTKKIANGRVSCNKGRSVDDLMGHDVQCTTTDYRIGRFWLPLKLRLLAKQNTPTDDLANATTSCLTAPL